MTDICLRSALADRFGPTGTEAADKIDLSEDAHNLLARMAARSSCRSFSAEPVPIETLRLAAAVALSAPTKSDLQQCDVILVENAEQRRRLNALIDGEGWAHRAPAFAVFCGNNRRQRLVHEWRGLPFANDHLDAFFNPAVDAAIVLSAFVTAAEGIGLGCCPVSAVRNHAAAVSDLLVLPDNVFPVAGLAVGWPAQTATVSRRLPLDVTVHIDGYEEVDLRGAVNAYDQAREATQPYPSRRYDEDHADRRNSYGWSEDKARQYARPERDDFGGFVRAKGFQLD